MSFLMICLNKQCGKEQETLLDVERDQVVCAKCDTPIQNVSPFARTQMRSLGQIKRNGQTQESFAVRCDACKKSGKPQIVNNITQCSFCKNEIKISAAFKRILSNK